MKRYGCRCGPHIRRRAPFRITAICRRPKSVTLTERQRSAARVSAPNINFKTACSPKAFVRFARESLAGLTHERRPGPRLTGKHLQCRLFSTFCTTTVQAHAPFERLEATTRLLMPHYQNRQNESKIVKQSTTPCFDRLFSGRAKFTLHLSSFDDASGRYCQTITIGPPNASEPRGAAGSAQYPRGVIGRPNDRSTSPHR